jgi:hypothetical protein
MCVGRGQRVWGVCSPRFERRDIVSGKKSAKSWAIREVIYVDEKECGA